jgi:hypothetical protein
MAFAYGFDAAGRVEPTLAILALAVPFTRNHGHQRYRRLNEGLVLMEA